MKFIPIGLGSKRAYLYSMNGTWGYFNFYKDGWRGQRSIERGIALARFKNELLKPFNIMFAILVAMVSTVKKITSRY